MTQLRDLMRAQECARAVAVQLVRAGIPVNTGQLLDAARLGPGGLK